MTEDPQFRAMLASAEMLVEAARKAFPRATKRHFQTICETALEMALEKEGFRTPTPETTER